MPRITIRSASGFTLLETVVATGILVTALAGLAQLFVLSLRLSDGADRRSAAVFAAQSKMEALRAHTFAYNDEGEPMTDDELAPSPPDALRVDVDGFSDQLDADGLVRRWTIAPLDDREPDALVIEVCVFRPPADDVPVTAAESCLATIRTRQP